MVVIEMENGGKIELELYPEFAPETVKNFETLVKAGFYDGLTFHRIIPGFMIQGGDPLGNGMGGAEGSGLVVCAGVPSDRCIRGAGLPRGVPSRIAGKAQNHPQKRVLDGGGFFGGIWLGSSGQSPGGGRNRAYGASGWLFLPHRRTVRHCTVKNG